MGKSSKTKVGCHYRLALHLGLTRGSSDAFLEFRAADKTAWQGEQTESGRIIIDAPELFGGEKDQGGIVGPVDVMFGEDTQTPNAYLLGLGRDQTAAWRGFTTLVFAGGRYGAMNPFAQKPSVKLRKINLGWDADFGEDVCWYPSRAEVGELLARAPVTGEHPWPTRESEYFVIGAAQEVAGTLTSFQGWWDGYVDSFRITVGVARRAVTEYAVPTAPFGNETTDPHYDKVVLLLRMLGSDGSTSFIDDRGHLVEAMGGAVLSTARSKFGGSSAYFNGTTSWLRAIMGADAHFGSAPWTMEAWVWLDSFRSTQYSRALFGHGPVSVGSNDTVWYLAGAEWRYLQLETGAVPQPAVNQNIAPWMETGRWAFVSVCWDGTRYWLHQDGKLLTGDVHPFAMNAAHALVYVCTDSEKGREPIDNLDQVNLRAAADQLYSEGFGLCWEYDPESDTPDSFYEQVGRIIAGRFSRSVVDGKWRLHLLREDYDFASLPILSDGDGDGIGLILSFRELPSTLDSAVNCLGVRYFDVERKEFRTVWARAPGLIRQFGEIRELLEFKWIPNWALAARVVERELRTIITPRRSYEISTDPRYRAIERYQTIRFQAHRHGIADMVCVVGDKELGTLRSGAIRWVLTEHVFAFADTQLVEIEEGVDVRPPQAPVPAEHSRIWEAPWVDVCCASIEELFG